MICNKCNIDKDSSQFNENRKTCKRCRLDRRKELYRENPEAKERRLEQGRLIDANRKDKRLIEQREKRFERKAAAIKYLGGCCVDCGLTHAPHCVYDFHHVDPTQKDNQVAVLMICSVETLYKELDKCVLLCSNCHRIRHFNSKEE